MVFLTKFHFYIKRSTEISGKGLLHFYQQASSLMDPQTNHWTNLFCSLKTNSRYESDYECIYIVIYGKRHSVPLNILSSVFRSFVPRGYTIYCHGARLSKHDR